MMKIDRVYKIYRMRRKKINPVNLVNPVYIVKGIPRFEMSDLQAAASAFRIASRPDQRLVPLAY
jgi:hypothetical protein